MRETCRQHRKRKFRFFYRAAVLASAAAALFLAYRWAQQKRINEALQAEQSRISMENERLRDEIRELTTVTGGVEEHGQLLVKGTQLQDQKGNPIVLRGLSSHGLSWYPEYTNYQALKTLKEYGASAFRIAMYVEQNDGYLEEPELNKKLLYAAIENSLAADLYTIVDWHVLRDENPKYYAEEAVRELEEVAKRYGNEPGILYEICNEPNGETTYEDIADYAKKVIPAIRKYAPDAVILVGTPEFCTSLSEALDNPLPYDNIMYTYHYYAGISDGDYAMETIGESLEGGLPVFVSEWGLDGYRANEEQWAETGRFLDFLEEKQISWISWSLSNKDEGYSMIRPESKKLHGWSGEELSSAGRFVLQRLSEQKD